MFLIKNLIYKFNLYFVRTDLMQDNEFGYDLARLAARVGRAI
jgi:hypothetical protein